MEPITPRLVVSANTARANANDGVDSTPIVIYTAGMSELVPTLRKELAAVEADVEKLEAEAAKLQARLRLSLEKAEKVKAVIALYANDAEEQPQPRLFASLTATSVAGGTHVRKQAARSSKAASLKMEVTDLLNARGTEHRQKILDHLVAKGLMGHEKDPLGSLAAYLSANKDVFMADGRGNFSLRREGHREPPPAPETGTGSAEGAVQLLPSNLSNTQLEGAVS